MKASAHADSGKRKRGGGPVKSTGQSRKRLKVQDARTIAVQTTEQAFRNGELDVQKYVKAREFEIQALEQSLARAKKGLNTRAFQELPRELRRRTASHNVKRIPKRLRKRAGKEVSIEPILSCIMLGMMHGLLMMCRCR